MGKPQNLHCRPVYVLCNRLTRIPRGIIRVCGITYGYRTPERIPTQTRFLVLYGGYTRRVRVDNRKQTTRLMNRVDTDDDDDDAGQDNSSVQNDFQSYLAL